MDEFITRAEAKQLIDLAVEKALISLSRIPRPFKIFGLRGTREYAEKVCRQLGKDITPHDEKSFSDGEIYCKPVSSSAGNVRGHNVFVIQSLYSDDLSVTEQRLEQVAKKMVCSRADRGVIRTFTDAIVEASGETVSDKFMKLVIMCGALRDASAHEVTVIIPHMAWARQDRKTESRAPITTKYIAQVLEVAGADRVLMIDAHNLAAEQNAFRIPVDNLETKILHARWCADELKRIKSKKIRVLTPDAGGLGRATRFRNALAHILGTYHPDDIQLCIFDKVREGGNVIGGRIIGDVGDADVIAYDDIISTAGTMHKSCRAVSDGGGRVFAICAAHGLFCGNANEVLNDFDAPLVVADTVDPFRLDEHNARKVRAIDTTKMVSDAIMRIHSGTGSISELLELS